MARRRKFGSGAATALLAAALGAASLASSAQASHHHARHAHAADAATSLITGSDTANPGHRLEFQEQPIIVTSGDRVTWINGTADPHSISLANKSDLPTKTTCPDCDVLFAAHFPDDTVNPALDNGTPVAPGNPSLPFETPSTPTQAGDSVLVAPAGSLGDSVTVTVDAPSGTTLHYFCIIHNWMHGTIQVR